MKNILKKPFFKYVIGEKGQNRNDLVISSYDDTNGLVIKVGKTTITGGTINNSLTNIFEEKLFKLDFDSIIEFLKYHYESYSGDNFFFIDYVLQILENKLEWSIKNHDYQRKLIYNSGLEWLKSNKKEEQLDNKTLTGSYVSLGLISELEKLTNEKFDTTKILQFLIEINLNYQQQNIISTSLLLRAFINHIPPIFGKENFESFVNHLKLSTKSILLPLQEQLRKIADYHTHMTISKKEFRPSILQIEPFKAGFELLIQEIIRELQK